MKDSPPTGAPEKVTEEMVSAAMERLQAYEVAAEYIDREMMTEILRAALQVSGTTKRV